jgi:hypothetical protein
MLSARGPRPQLKGKAMLIPGLMDDVDIPSFGTAVYYHSLHDTKNYPFFRRVFYILRVWPGFDLPHDPSNSRPHYGPFVIVDGGASHFDG